MQDTVNLVFVDDAHTFGGAQIALRNTIYSLLQSGKYHITLFSTSENIEKIFTGDTLKSVDVFVIPSARRLNILVFIFSLLETYRVLAPRLKDQSTVWIMNLSGIEFCLSSLCLLRIKSQRTIGWLHNSRAFSDLMPSLSVFRRMLNKLRDRIANQFIFSIYQQIIVPSESESLFLASRIKHNRNIFVVRNSVIPQFFSSEQSRILDKYSDKSIDEFRLRIYIIGRIEFSTKGQDKCISICDALIASSAPAHFIFVGDGPDAGELKQDFEKAGFAKYFTITGWKERPFDQITPDDIILITSKFESGSLVAAESMMRGLRIVSSTLDVFREILPSNCIVDSENAFDYAYKILFIRNADLQILRIMYQNILKEFSPEAMEHNFSRVVGAEKI